MFGVIGYECLGLGEKGVKIITLPVMLPVPLHALTTTMEGEDMGEEGEETLMPIEGEDTVTGPRTQDVTIMSPTMPQLQLTH